MWCFSGSVVLQHENYAHHRLVCVSVSQFKYCFLKSNLKLCEIKMKYTYICSCLLMLPSA